MKFIIVLFVALFALACGSPNGAEIKELRSDVGPENWSFKAETSDGTVIQQDGQLNNVGSDHEAAAVKGSYSWVADDGVTYTVNYVADENGYQPEGVHIPKP